MVLLNEVPRTDKIPIYINLKEWDIPYNLSIDPLPSSSDIFKSLYQFVHNNLKERLWDGASEKFLDRYFEPMMENGMFFIILDSFDEILYCIRCKTSLRKLFAYCQMLFIDLLEVNIIQEGYLHLDIFENLQIPP